MTLPVADYAIAGRHHEFAIERKSKVDLFGSMNNDEKRDNFERRLTRMNRMGWSAVVVEACWDEVINDPPEHTEFDPKCLYRTVIAWQQRFSRVHWWFCYSRDFAEVTTFRLLQRWYEDRPEGRIRAAANIIL
jgi:hypothetical protein